MSDVAAEGAPSVPQRTKPYAWLVLGMLCFIYVFNFLDRQLMSILTESIKRDLGFTDKQMGYMTGLYFALVYTLFGVVVGFLADRTSRRNILFAGAFLWSLFTVACGLAKDYPSMLGARVGVGVGEAAGAPPSYSIISDYFPAEKRGMALAIFSLGVPFGQALGAAFGAQIDAMFGWEMAFIGIGVAGMIASVVMLLVVREPKRGAMDPPHIAAMATEKASFANTAWEFLNRPMLLWAALACGMCSFVGYCALNWNASFLIRVKGITREEMAIWYAGMLAVSMGLGTWVSGYLADKFGKRSKVWYALVPLCAMAASLPFWFAYIVADGWVMAVAILAGPTFFTIMYLAPALAVVQNSVKPSQRTMAGALLLMVLNIIGLGGGPTMVGILSTMFSEQHVMAALGVSHEQAVEYLRMPAAQLATLPDIGPAVATASAQGLTDAFWWVTPFYGVAIFFLGLQALATKREIAAGAPVRDGGFRVGIVLTIVGAAGLYLRSTTLGPMGAVLDLNRLATFGEQDLTARIDTGLDVFSSLAVTVFLLWGLYLLFTTLTRKKPAEA
jgi:predicted MFS family arabinose efflux permease